MDEEKVCCEMTDQEEQSDDSVDMDYYNWNYLPDPIILQIFKYLSPHDVLASGRACKNWYSVSYDDLLWKAFVYRDFKIDRSVEIMPGKNSWMMEYKRLTYHLPVVMTEVLGEHTHQVLHVSFAHNGKYFATCSKDGYVNVWRSTYPSTIKYQKDMKVFCWKYTQFSQFNQSDTLLLVSGVHFGTPHSTSGEIAVFSLQGGFNLQCRVVNKPYDIFGTWYSDHYLLSGDLHWLAHLISASVLWVNKASQEVSSEHVPIMNQLYKFYNCNASSIRAVMVANCLTSKDSSEKEATDEEKGSDVHKASKNVRGNPPSHRDMAGIPRAHSSQQQDPGSQVLGFAPVDSAQHNWCKLGDGLEYASPIYYNQDYRQVETQHTTKGSDNDIPEEYVEEPVSVSEESPADAENASEASEVSLENDCNSEGDDISEVNVEKLLIFTTGYRTYTPHQIGFKKIKPVSFPRRMDPGPSLAERIAERQRERDRESAGDPPRPELNWVDYDSVADRFDSIDHLIDLHGHVIGMGLSPDHRYLYVNSRPWPEGCVITNPLYPPPIAQEIDIHVIDLVTLKEVGTMLRAHKAYTPNNECFFIFLDVCNEYVASGAEDKHGYLWDRHYGVCLAKYPHNDVVNSVAFNPRDPEMLVTTSDDFFIKVWRSRNRVNQLGIPNAEDWPRSLEIRLKATQKSPTT